MINKQTKNNKGLARHNVRSTLGGFTLVEALFAVFILTFTISSLMTVVSNSLFTARYARDEIIANYLLQEVVDYIRNDRDTIVFLDSGTSWDNFVSKYTNYCSGAYGCYFDVLNASIPTICNTQCPDLYYNENATNTPFYVNDDGGGMSGMLKTSFKRKIVVKQNALNGEEIDVIVTINWKNGGKDVMRSLSTSLMKWQ